MDRNKASDQICKHLKEKYNLIPSAVTPSVEADVCIFYKNHRNGYSLIIEAYNDGDIAGIVNDDRNKRIIFAEEVNDFNFSKLVEHLKGETNNDSRI